MNLRALAFVAACVLAVGACSSSSSHRVGAGSTGSTTSTEAGSPTTLAELGAPADAPTTLAAAGSATAGSPTTSRPSGNAPTRTTVASQPATTAAPAPSPTTTPSGTVVSSTNNSSYGQILVDAHGRTLYLFTPDDGMSAPQCTGSCAQTWPPLKASGAPKAEGSAKQSLLGVEAGQVTYNGHPLYLYSGDSAPGQTNGEGVGGIWYVINTDGSPVLH